MTQIALSVSTLDECILADMDMLRYITETPFTSVITFGRVTEIVDASHQSHSLSIGPSIMGTGSMSVMDIPKSAGNAQKPHVRRAR